MKAGWETKSFEDCIEKVTYTVKVQRKDFLPEGEFPIVSQEMDDINGYWDDEGDVFKLTRPVVLFGDHTKILKYVDFDFVLGADGVKILPPKSFLFPKFFYYQLQSIDLDSLGYARHYRLLKEQQVTYPPLPEQHRIVAILDKAFDGIARAKAAAQANLQNARAVFESYLQEVFTRRGEGWVETDLVSCCDQIFAGGDVPTDRFSLEKNEQYKIPVIANGIKNDGVMGFTDAPRVLKPCVTISARGTIGFVVMRKEPFLPVVRLIVLLSDESQMELSFLYYGVRGLDFSNSGTSIPQLTVPNLKMLKISFPSKLQQKQIVTKLDELAEQTQHLESLYQRKIAALDELKKSLLHQAFSGAL